MSNYNLRTAAREVFYEAQRAVHAGDAVKRAVRLDGTALKVYDFTIDLAEGRQVYAIGIGKAAQPMATALEDLLKQRLTRGLIISSKTPLSVPISPQDFLTRWAVYEGGHPLPNKGSLAAAEEALTLLEKANRAEALVIFLLSGGGSAMIEWPVCEDITLEDLRSANELLVNCGASISEINSVRRAFSAIKGGGLASKAPNCDQITLVISDVPKGQERNVASGPTLHPPEDAPDPRNVIARYGLDSQLPQSILRAISNYSPSKAASRLSREHFVLLDNDDALEAAAAAARQRGFKVEIAKDISDQPIDKGCHLLVERMRALRAQNHSDEIVGVISGGEFACPVKGDGMGGRNLETALRLAMEAENKWTSGDFVALCAGTDGIDGNSPAAGALVDSTTIPRAKQIGLDPRDFLDRSDSYSFFVALGDAITTGPTGTNVRDLRILFAASIDA